MTTDAEYEAMMDEMGAALGDPRRCPRHPGEKTSSNDGMFDAPCGACEFEMGLDEDYGEAHAAAVAAGFKGSLLEFYEARCRAERAAEAAKPAEAVAATNDDDILF